MYRILRKEILNPQVIRMAILAPAVARKAQPGQFVILRTYRNGERIPLTIADYDREEGSVTIIFQKVGATTEELARISEGECIPDFVGPLGRPTETDGLRNVVIVAGGVGSAIAYPMAKKLAEQGTNVRTITGYRSRDLVILEKEFRACSDEYHLVTDDGSAGNKGLVTDALRTILQSGDPIDQVIAIGPLVMMKFVCQLTRELGVKTIVSMNPVMIDGTGMCGGCRLTVGGKTRFACVDGPEFDGNEVDFPEAISRASMYRELERGEHEKTCRLFAQGGEIALCKQ